MLEVLDAEHIVGKWLLFKDVGKVSRGSKTNKFEVIRRVNGELLGYVKWFVMWRKYCFYSLNSVLDTEALDELSLYCKTMTDKYKSSWKPRPKFRPRYDRTKRLGKKIGG